MAGIVFYFENSGIDVYSGRDADLSAWNHLCKVADIDKAIIINTSGQNVTTFDASMDVQIVTQFPELVGHVTQFVVPGETPGSVDLWSWDHTTDWYVFGPAAGWQGNYFGDTLVHLPQATTAGAYSMQVGTVVMYDRFNRAP